MKTFWKWFFGILIALAVIVAIPLGMHLLMNNGYIAPPAMYAWHHGSTGPAFDKPYGFSGGEGPRGFGDNDGWGNRGEGHRRHEFGFFGPLMFFGGLLKLAVFFGLLYGAYWLGKRNARIAFDPAPTQAVTPAPAPKRGGRAAKKG
jgi:hypothetical protein